MSLSVKQPKPKTCKNPACRASFVPQRLGQNACNYTCGLAIKDVQVFMNSAFIQDGTITNAKIGNFIASNNYVAGVSGWKLFFDGTFEINSAFGGQARQVINNAGGKVFDENGTKRYQWGDLSA